MPYKNPSDRAEAQGRYYWRKKFKENGFEYNTDWSFEELKNQFHRIKISQQVTKKSKQNTESVTELENPVYVDERRLFAYDNPVVHEMPVSPNNYSQGVDDFYSVQDILLEEDRKVHWSGLSDEAVERISEGTAPLLFDRDFDLLPLVAEFDDFLEDIMLKKIEESKDKVWRFF